MTTPDVHVTKPGQSGMNAAKHELEITAGA
jgi:hypothetical protein